MIASRTEKLTVIRTWRWWGIWLGDEIIWIWGEQKTTVKSEQAGWGVDGVSQKVVSDEKPSSFEDIVLPCLRYWRGSHVENIKYHVGGNS
jgi:hypothetical protein